MKKFTKLNEGFRDDINSIDDVFSYRTFRDKVASSLTDIIAHERGISEKSFNAYDGVMEEIERFYEDRKDELIEMLKEYESRGSRPSYLAEVLYDKHFK